MDKDVYKILEYMNTFKYRELVDLAPIINKLFPFPNDKEFDKQKNALSRFIEHLEKDGYVKYNGGWSNLADSKTVERWFGNGYKDYKFEALIELYGLVCLNQEKSKRIQDSVNESLINTNKAIKYSIYGQIIIGFITMWAIIITAFYAKKTYEKDDLKPIYTLIQSKAQLLDSLQVLQKERNMYLKTMAKRSSIDVVLKKK